MEEKEKERLAKIKLRRKIEVPKKPSSELNDVLRKLKEMGEK